MSNCLNFGKRYEDDNAYFSNPVRFRFVELHQVGELYCESGYRVEPHVQRVFEITYVVAGKATVITDGKACLLEENDVYINIPGQMHEILADQGVPFRFCYLGFSFTGAQDLEVERFYRSWTARMKAPCKELLEIFSAVLTEIHDKPAHHRRMVGALTERLVLRVYRGGTEQSGAFLPLGEPRMGNAVYAVVRYIDQHYRDIDDIRALAATLGYSYTYLAHIFKEKMGTTIGSYVLYKKMEEAKWLLRSGRMSVTQIASRFNYKSVQSFSNSFKKSVGISPAEFQALPADQAAEYTDFYKA